MVIFVHVIIFIYLSVLTASNSFWVFCLSKFPFSGFIDRKLPQENSMPLERSSATTFESASSQPTKMGRHRQKNNTLGVLGAKFFDSKIPLKKKVSTPCELTFCSTSLHHPLSSSSCLLFNFYNISIASKGVIGYSYLM